MVLIRSDVTHRTPWLGDREDTGGVRVLSGLCFAAAVMTACTAEGPRASSRSWQQIRCDSALGSPATTSDELRVSRGGWKTDFSRHCVPLSEIGSGGPSRDGIPPLDRPAFIPANQAEAWLKVQEPVIAVSEGDTTRAYPLQILIWHEIVNDTIAGRPIVVTFCPLCNTSLVFDRRVGDRELTFGTTGNLRYSDLVMWDRQTESWWQQATGEAIVGELTATRLTRVRSAVLSFEEFRAAYPTGEVLSRAGADQEMERKGGGRRHYGSNPYVGYDRADQSPITAFWGDRPVDARLPPKARVAVATFADPPVAYVTDGLTGAVATNDTVAGRRLALFFQSGVASPLDRSLTSDGADVGQAIFYDAVVEGRTLSFRASGRAFIDDQTGSTWSVTGVATAGPLRGKRLTMLDHEFTYWFIWSVFRPDTEVRSWP